MPLKMFKFHFVTNLNCNLNCKLCNVHAYSFKEPFLYSIDQLISDCQILSQLVLPSKIYILGGESLLLGLKLLNYVSVIRKYFNSSKLMLITNGILLEQYKQIIPFFDDIFITNYGLPNLNLDYLCSLSTKSTSIISMPDPIKHINFERPLKTGSTKVCNIFKIGHSEQHLNFECITVYDGYLYGCNRPITSGRIYNHDYHCDGIKLDSSLTEDKILSYFNDTKVLESCKYCAGLDAEQYETMRIQYD